MGASGEFEFVGYEKHDRVATITLRRPDVLNAMNVRMHEELARVWADFESDPQIWVGVLTGAGERAFSVGQDLKELAHRDARGTAGVSSFGSRGKPGAPRLTDRFDITKPLVAKVRGYALGGGFELALACDLVVASTDAQFGLPEVRLGLVAGAGGVFRLGRQLPPRVAAGYLLTGRRMTAHDALRYGLVNEVVAPAELDAATQAWVDDLLLGAPLAVSAAKQALWRSLDLPLPDAFEEIYPSEELRKRSADAREGPRAFAEGRPPKWTGK
ncbi:enoyl-CoA-hydratase DpgD [Mycobacterium paragordonae]|uniref:Enoyl-CoA hydratase-related protein n=1 Tax=Mycobacterium paragordonae TaxID=1389713 RepID=A0AAJ1W9E9_9MYCO|nr:enoyl-CoA-hydratase DpgD [Mycobacterium paragordonae]MDP7739609.1 enoyl-CoA hydratase-related protein [Mycobacterium paragordonae]